MVWKKNVAILGIAICMLCTSCSTSPQASVNYDEIGDSIIICVDEMVPAIKAITRRFARENPNLEVDIVLIPDYNYPLEREAFLTSLQTEILAGRGPDVLFLSSSSTTLGSLFADENKVMATGMLEDISAWLSKDTMDALQPAILSAGQLDGKQYIIPVDYELDALLFSSSSWPDAQHLFENANNSVDIASVLPQLYNTFEDPWRVSFDISKEIQATMVDYIKSTVTLDYAALEILLQANKISMDIERDWLPSGNYLASGENSPLIPFARQYINLGLSPSEARLVSAAYKQVQATPVPVLLPNSAGGITANVYNYAVIPANSANKVAAAAFIDFLLAPDYQSTINSVSAELPWVHGLPVRKGCIVSLYTELGFVGDSLEAIQEIENAITNACFVPEDFRTIVEEQENRFYQGEVTAAEALSNIENRLKLYF